ncbi:methyl-accepting chemotaxis protein [Formivibrio citricus]|uniref:Methyl-accepting chemotaxis protein n=1 Tax=Formivibrio citricus TaxID=83765 RepID=A0A1I4W0E1_9NEIS|nr:methyl-accepting chemotaxis protein [Formivibrio citricus]SFN06865.1 methyl-accepting chemotaxis protein [Formivibrio citricus]
MALTIARRLQIMIGCSILALIVLAVSGAQVASHLRGGVDYLYTNAMPSIQTLDDVHDDYMNIRVLVLYHMLVKDPAQKTGVEKKVAEHKEQLQKKLARYEKELLSDAKDKELLEANKKLFANYFATLDALFAKSRANDQEGALAEIGKPENRENLTKLLATLEAHGKYNDKLAEDFHKSSMASDRRGQIISLILIVAAILGVGSMGFFLLRSINKALHETQSAITHIESHLDFTRRVEVHSGDELGITAKAINRLLEKLQDNLKTIATGAQSVAAAANQMAATSSQVAKASQQQSEAASGMAATVEEMTVSINHVADRAQEANRISCESGQLAASGERVIGQTAEGINQIAGTVHDAAARIHELEQHSAQISNVVAVIKEVADQTNLLALNAAIEAARAGEQGRGFAVVADEVRKLAERTAASTQEISRTIETMRAGASNAVQGMQGAVAEVGQGVERAQEANDSIRQIGEGSRSAVGMVEEIATAIREQGTATNNIAIQVEKIAQMSEESSAAAEESARAARDLDRLAGEMHGIVAAYRL